MNPEPLDEGIFTLVSYNITLTKIDDDQIVKTRNTTYTILQNEAHSGIPII